MGDSFLIHRGNFWKGICPSMQSSNLALFDNCRALDCMKIFVRVVGRIVDMGLCTSYIWTTFSILAQITYLFLYSSSSPFSFLLWWDNFFPLVSKVLFGTQKVLGKEKKILRKMISHVWFHHGKYIRKSNIVKIPQNFIYFYISWS